MNEEEASRIWLSVPHMGGQEQEYVKAVFDSNWVTSGGPMVTAFETELEGLLRADKSVVALNSGTSALHLALVLLGVQAGDEVLCQSMTFVASANPILYLGATPVFVDSEPITWNICPVALEEAIVDRIKKGKKPKCIIAVTLYGMPYQVESIQALSQKYDIPVIEDSAEAFGSTYKGQACGTFGAIGIFSFNGSKIITTSGGGALVVPNRELKTKALFLATQAKDTAPYYQHSAVGYNYRMTSVSAAIGRGQLTVFDEHLKMRKEVHSFYADFLKDFDGLSLQENPNPDYDSNFWLNTVLLEDCYSPLAVREAFEQFNTETRLLWKPMHLQPLYASFPYYGNSVAASLFERGLCLPSSSNMTEVQQTRITKALCAIFKNKKNK